MSDEQTIERTPHPLIPFDLRKQSEVDGVSVEDLAAIAGIPVEPELSRNDPVSVAGKSILQEADEIAGQSRSRYYGHPFTNHQRIADIWNVIAEHYIKTPLTPRVVALMMIGLKLAREVNAKQRDNLVDIAGYVKCVDMIDEHIEKASNGV